MKRLERIQRLQAEIDTLQAIDSESYKSSSVIMYSNPGVQPVDDDELVLVKLLDNTYRVMEADKLNWSLNGGNIITFGVLKI